MYVNDVYCASGEGGFVERKCRPQLFSFVRRLPLPRGDEGPTQVGGQALDKARGRKPRNEARPFNRGAALWAFERRPTAQVRDVHGAAPCAACCVKPLPALGGMGGVSAARHVMRRRVAGAAGFDQVSTVILNDVKQRVFGHFG